MEHIQEWAKTIQKTPDQTEWLRYAQQIEAESRQCRQHLQNLVDYIAKEPEKKAIDLNRLLDRAWRKIETDPNFNPAIEVIRGYDPQLPPVSADPDQIEKALYFVLQNSLRTMPNSGTLRMITRAMRNEVQVIVNSTGQDNSAGEGPSVFDPFYKNTDRAFGLDMSISYGIIEHHNGTIEIDSKSGKGTTITLRLPLERVK
jgi:two-component system NtrC family sensor kinase